MLERLRYAWSRFLAAWRAYPNDEPEWWDL
jgi:hypothetical protein